MPHGLLQRTLVDGLSLPQQAPQRRGTLVGLQKRLQRALPLFLAQPASPDIPPGALVLLIDGLWVRFRRRPSVLYLMALKPVHEARAIFLDPVLLPGKETRAGWMQALQTIPPDIAGRVCALISDGIRGAKGLARERGWIHQRCHFHLLAQLYGRLGRHKHLPARRWRERVFSAVRTLLVTRDDGQLLAMQRRLRALTAQPRAHARLRMIVRDFLADLESFRAYLRYPELALPNTTNTVESMVNTLRPRLRPLRTPAAVLRWATGVLRLQTHRVCNAKYYQPD